MEITKDTLKLNNGNVVYPKTTSDQVLDLENTVVNYLEHNEEIQTGISVKINNTINNALEEGGSIKNAINAAVSDIPANSLPNNLVYISGTPSAAVLTDDGGNKLYDTETFLYNHIVSMMIEGGSMPLIITFTLTLKSSTPITEFVDLRRALKVYYGGNGVTFEPVVDESAAVNNNGVAICIKSGGINTLILTFITLSPDTGLGVSDFPITINNVGSINDTVIKL